MDEDSNKSITWMDPSFIATAGRKGGGEVDVVKVENRGK